MLTAAYAFTGRTPIGCHVLDHASADVKGGRLVGQKNRNKKTLQPKKKRAKQRPVAPNNNTYKNRGQSCGTQIQGPRGHRRQWMQAEDCARVLKTFKSMLTTCPGNAIVLTKNSVGPNVVLLSLNDANRSCCWYVRRNSVVNIDLSARRVAALDRDAGCPCVVPPIFAAFTGVPPG